MNHFCPYLTQSEKDMITFDLISTNTETLEATLGYFTR